MQNQARSTNLDSAIERSIAIGVLATPGIVYCVTSSFPHHATRAKKSANHVIFLISEGIFDEISIAL